MLSSSSRQSSFGEGALLRDSRSTCNTGDTEFEQIFKQDSQKFYFKTFLVASGVKNGPMIRTGRKSIVSYDQDFRRDSVFSQGGTLGGYII